MAHSVGRCVIASQTALRGASADRAWASASAASTCPASSATSATSAASAATGSSGTATGTTAAAAAARPASPAILATATLAATMLTAAILTTVGAATILTAILTPACTAALAAAVRSSAPACAAVSARLRKRTAGPQKCAEHQRADFDSIPVSHSRFSFFIVIVPARRVPSCTGWEMKMQSCTGKRWGSRRIQRDRKVGKSHG
jgi:hypothetical protein